MLSREYDVQDLCALMGVSRSGYYKWKKRDKSERDIMREGMPLLKQSMLIINPTDTAGQRHISGWNTVTNAVITISTNASGSLV